MYIEKSSKVHTNWYTVSYCFTEPSHVSDAGSNLNKHLSSTPLLYVPQSEQRHRHYRVLLQWTAPKSRLQLLNPTVEATWTDVPEFGIFCDILFPVFWLPSQQIAKTTSPIWVLFDFDKIRAKKTGIQDSSINRQVLTLHSNQKSTSSKSKHGRQIQKAGAYKTGEGDKHVSNQTLCLLGCSPSQ